MLRTINRTLRSYDNFGVPITLNMNKQTEYKSVCGGVLSVMMTVVLIYILVTGLIGVFDMSTYTIEVQQLQDMDPDLKVMNKDNFMFAIKLDNPFKDKFPDVNKTPFHISIHQGYVKTEQDGTRVKNYTKTYSFETCTTEHFPSINFKEFHQISNQLKNYLCLPIDYELWLQGTYNSQVMYYPKISVSLCRTEECYSDEQIAELARNASTMVSLSTIIQSSIFMANSSLNPLQQYLNSDFFLSTNFDAESTADIFFQSNKIINQKSIFSFYADDQNMDYWVFPIYSYREVKKFNDVPSSLFSVVFRLSQEFSQTTKKVNTIDQFLSYFGGMLKIISSVFGIVALQYNQMGLKLSLANSLYDFNVPQQKNGAVEFSYEKLLKYIQGQINKLDETINKLKNHAMNVVKMSKITRAITLRHQTVPTLQSDKRCSLIIDQQNMDKDKEDLEKNQSSVHIQEVKETFLKDLFHEILASRQKLQLGINFIFYQLLCCTCIQKVQMTRKMLHQCENVVIQDLDIVNILRKLQQIEKLKQALLQKDQIKVFNYTPKPIVNIETRYKFQPGQEGDPTQLIKKTNQHHKHNRLIRSKHYNQPNNLLKIYKSYSKLKDENNQINQRIIELMGPAMEQIFDKYYQVQQLYNNNHKGEQNHGDGYPQLTDKLISDVVSPSPKIDDTQKKSIVESRIRSHIQLQPKTLNEQESQNFDD